MSRIGRAPIAIPAGVESIELRGDDANNIEDVRAYFSTELDAQLNESGEREAILDGLSERSGGIYLYAAMIVDGVRKGKMDLKRKSEYPRGLSGVFTDWFGWFFPDRTEYKNTFLRALSMLIASPEPLPEEELVRTLG